MSRVRWTFGGGPAGIRLRSRRDYCSWRRQSWGQGHRPHLPPVADRDTSGNMLASRAAHAATSASISALKSRLWKADTSRIGNGQASLGRLAAGWLTSSFQMQKHPTAAGRTGNDSVAEAQMNATMSRSFNGTDLNASYDSTPAFGGTAETDVIYRSKPQDFRVSGTGSHEKGHATGPLHPNGSAPAKSPTATRFECMTNAAVSSHYGLSPDPTSPTSTACTEEVIEVTIGLVESSIGSAQPAGGNPGRTGQKVTSRTTDCPYPAAPAAGPAKGHPPAQRRPTS